MKQSSTTHLIITIFGVTGDLYRTKLARALYSLYLENLLPDHFTIVGFARRPFTDDAFRELTKEALPSDSDPTQRTAFLLHFNYVQGDLQTVSDFHTLSTVLAAEDAKQGSCSDKLFYLATQPSLYETIFRNIAAAGLTIPCAPGASDDAHTNWTRVLVEKPFGEDLSKAEQLDKLLSELFDESQIFRIDHYLAKETVQNILAFRFSNAVFESLWNKDAIDRVRIVFHEHKTITSRGGFYEGVGALRDVGQNHMLQMLAILGMEKPDQLQPETIRAQRAAVLEKTVLLEGDHRELVRAQYDGYLQESHVAGDSETETFFRVALGINNDRWRGVPFVLESGKALNESRVSLEMYFKGSADCHCPTPHPQGHQNVLTFNVQPNEGIHFTFWFKQPGFDSALEPQDLSFTYARDVKDQPLHDAYERVLYDGIQGDQTLFTNTQEVVAEWRLIGEILAAWQSVPLGTYPQGAEAKTIGA